MNKTNEWLKTNSIKLNFDEVIKAFEESNITNYGITANFNGDCNINFTFEGRSYRIEIDKEKLCFNLLSENLALNPFRKIREHRVKSFYGENLILQVLKFIKNKSIKKYKMIS